MQVSPPATYKVLVPISKAYDVGRNNIGIVVFSMNAGDKISGQIVNNRLRINAVYFKDGVNYFTPLFFDLNYFAETTPERTYRSSAEVIKSQIPLFIILTIALIVSK